MNDTNPLSMPEHVPHTNNYAEGTLEWHAWGDGNTYAEACDLPTERFAPHHGERHEPMSGEYGDDPGPAQVILNVWRHIFGPSWSDDDTDDFFAKATDEDQDESATKILDAWEEGYHAFFGDKYGELTEMQSVVGLRYTKSDKRDRNKDVADALTLTADPGHPYHTPLLHLHYLGYDVSNASVVNYTERRKV